MDLAEIYAVGIIPFTPTTTPAAATAAAAARYATPNIVVRTCVLGE